MAKEHFREPQKGKSKLGRLRAEPLQLPKADEVLLQAQEIAIKCEFQALHSSFHNEEALESTLNNGAAGAPGVVESKRRTKCSVCADLCSLKNTLLHTHLDSCSI